MQSVFFDYFMIHAGSDSAGVGTEMVTMNSTVKLIFRNTGTFFGIHVSPTPLDLFFSELSLASGTVRFGFNNFLATFFYLYFVTK